MTVSFCVPTVYMGPLFFVYAKVGDLHPSVIELAPEYLNGCGEDCMLWQSVFDYGPCNVPFDYWFVTNGEYIWWDYEFSECDI